MDRSQMVPKLVNPQLPVCRNQLRIDLSFRDQVATHRAYDHREHGGGRTDKGGGFYNSQVVKHDLV